MDHFWEIMRHVGFWLGIVGVVLLCVAGVALSCLSLCGTWVVTGAAALAAVLRPGEFPGWWTVVVFAVISAVVEVVEAVAGAWGVEKRGGSKLAGFLALAGGLVGMFLGGLIPIPIAGPLVGMLVCSFFPVYYVERRRLANSEQAVSIAFGSVVARVAVILLKVLVSLGFSAFLLLGMLIGVL